jgi:hypothetical protein
MYFTYDDDLVNRLEDDRIEVIGKCNRLVARYTVMQGFREIAASTTDLI